MCERLSFNPVFISNIPATATKLQLAALVRFFS